MHARVSRPLRGMGAEEPTMFVLQLAEDLGERFKLNSLLAQMKRELLVEIRQFLSRFGIESDSILLHLIHSYLE